ncbi:MAG: putative lipid II flippase FtsW [Chloroflexi bacterium]|nr:putative lipid II flippase FtsW [Chloroflexota bacterium]
MNAAVPRLTIQRGSPDYLLLALVAGLILIGLQAVYSATFALAYTEYDNVFYFLLRQGLWATIGALLLVFCLWLDYRIWKLLSPLVVLMAVVTLVLVLLPGFGSTQYGATRWLKLGPLPPTQPSEFVKLAVVIGLAAWLSGPGRPAAGGGKGGLVPLALFLGIVTALIMKQPDLGTTLVILMTAATMYFLAGAELRSILALVASGLAGGAVLVMGAAYRMERWQSFLDPWQDPAGIGFHIIQLLVALGSGGLFGLGIGASRQKFFYIPGAHTDGIFAIIGEELGFVGVLVVVCLFAAVVYRGALVVKRSPDAFGALLATGIICWIAYQTLINIGGITRSVPLTGIPLPFISYGGSSLAATMAAVGILLNISRQASTSPTGPLRERGEP